MVIDVKEALLTLYDSDGRRVGEAGADTDAHVVLVRVVPVPPGDGSVQGILIQAAGHPSVLRCALLSTPHERH